MFEKLMDRWFFYACLLGAVLCTRIQPIAEIPDANRMMVIPMFVLILSPLVILLPRIGYRIYTVITILLISASTAIQIILYEDAFLFDSLLFLIIVISLLYELRQEDHQVQGITLSAKNILYIILAFISVYTVADWHGPDFIWFRILPFILCCYMISYPVSNRVTLRTLSIISFTVILYHALITYQREEDLLLFVTVIPHLILSIAGMIRSLSMPTTGEIDIRMKDWIESHTLPPFDNLDTYGDISARITIFPWVSNPNRFIPRYYRKMVLQGLDTIYSDWDLKRNHYAGYTDMQIWVFDTYIGLSEVVCAKVDASGDERNNYFDPAPDERRFNVPPRLISAALPDYRWDCYQVIDRKYEYIDGLSKREMRRLRRRGYREIREPEHQFCKAIDTVWVGRKKIES